MRLEGKIAVITGAGSGMGKAMALRFTEERARVVLADISGKQDEVAAGINEAAKAAGVNAAIAVPVHANVSIEDDVRNMIATAENSFGRLDILCNNAGFGGPMAALADQSLEVWNRVHDTNIKGAFLGMKYGIASMLKTGGGAIVNTTSASGVVGWMHHSVYGAAKAGVNQLTKSAALDYSGHNIRINAIAPGPIDTEANRTTTPQEMVADIVKGIPLSRMGEVDDLTGMCLFLLSDQAKWVTGQIFNVDGGQIIR